MNRRHFLSSASGAVAVGAIALGSPSRLFADHHEGEKRIYKSLKMGMFNENIPIKEKFEIMRELGFDGAELNSPGGENKEEALKASQELNFPIHGVVDSIHWGVRLSDPDPAVREKSLQGLLTAIRESKYVGGDAVLLVPGKVDAEKDENFNQVWTRSIEGIRKALPLCSKLGVRILIENVWNGFLFDPAGDDNQTAGLLAGYLDEIDSPWVGSYFDIGNHQRYAKPADWIRQLGSRIVKVDVKDWGKTAGFCKIGDGDIDWPDVRAALKEIQYTGWATAEVAGGDRKRMKEVSERMDKYLLGL